MPAKVIIDGGAAQAALAITHSLPDAAAGRIDKGVEVDYIAHVPGGMVKVRHNNQEVIAHPLSFVELAT